MKKTRLIAVDLDGTLFGPAHQLTSRTIDTLHQVEQRGHTIVVVTGRSAHSAMPRLKSLPPQARVVCSNGAYEHHREQGNTVWSEPLPATTVVHLRDQILQNLPTASFGWETASGLAYEATFTDEAGGAHTLEQGGAFEELGKSDALKLYVRSPQYIRGDLQRFLLPVVAAHAEVSTSGVPFVELTARGVDKASGLARVAGELGFNASQTIAFGDNLNDIPMLQWAHESVAMGNAMDEVKAVAVTATQSNVDDGVAHYLETKIESGEL